MDIYKFSVISLVIMRTIEASSLKYHLTSTPAIEGQPCTLSCKQDKNIGTSLWYRNWVWIFQTNRNYRFEMLDKNTDHEEFRSVSGRISVDATLIRHNVILTINSTLDEGSVWRCGLGEDSSNNLTVRVVKPVTDGSTTTQPQTTSIVSKTTTTTEAMTENKDYSATHAFILTMCGIACCLILVIGSTIILFARSRLTA
ncbi:uncharacterized protein [Haliotis cracherodii]|uniref:uncharacterized protein n=1 Tax=Haliotis cracherodii TaxID=6455 RepID=UPI0039E7CD3B